MEDGIDVAGFALTPLLKRASTRRREEEVFMGVHMIQQVAAVHLGWGQAHPVWTQKRDMRARYGCYLNDMVNIEGATWGVVRAFGLPNGASVRANPAMMD